jgi:hypothetical protein
MSIDKIRFTIRIDETILEKIKAISDINRRSANMEIENILAEYVTNYEKLHGNIRLDNE